MGQMRVGVSLKPGARRWYDPAARYLGLLSLLVTVVSTVVVFVRAGEDPGAIKDLVSAVLGLTGVAVALQLETLFRIAERSQTRERYGRLLEGVEDYPDLLDTTCEALDASVRTLDRATLPQLKMEVFHVLHHAVAQLQDLAQGRLRRSGSDNTLVLDRFSHTKEVVRGTTDEGDTSWWESADGKQFLALNKELIGKNVRVERLWILSAAPTKELLDMLDEHHRAGVVVFAVRTDRKDIDRRLLVNFTIMDESFLQLDVPNKEGQAVEYLYSENPVDIERQLNMFAQLKSKASRYTGPGSLKALS